MTNGMKGNSACYSHLIKVAKERTMKIHLISDIHNEIEVVKTSIPKDTDVVVLAGDIHSGTAGVEWAQNNFGTDIPIVYICGNHEFYHHDLSVVEEIAEAAEGTNVRFLDNSSTVIDGVRFIGSTLWTSFDDWKDQIKINFFHNNMNDYEYIKALWFFDEDEARMAEAQKFDRVLTEDLFAKNHFKLRPVITYLLHKESMRFLEKAIEEPFDGKTVVVTHHAPSYQSVGYYSKQAYEDAYASSLEYFICKHKPSIDVWFHGHLHRPVKYFIDGVPVVSNPRDYPMYGKYGSAHEFLYEL
ncbi:MAG: hypothetical protein COB22_05365 [Cycloclasticus sp.]|nr:MAG: hypothetical protein COB22_05365 [Cycloclasticus sp.]